MYYVKFGECRTFSKREYIKEIKIMNGPFGWNEFLTDILCA